MIIRMYTKSQHWRWWMRFIRPSLEFHSKGCTDTFCGPVEPNGCRCNDWYAKRKEILAKGFKEAGVFWPSVSDGPVHVWTDGKRVVLERGGTNVHQSQTHH